MSMLISYAIMFSYMMVGLSIVCWIGFVSMAQVIYPIWLIGVLILIKDMRR